MRHRVSRLVAMATVLLMLVPLAATPALAAVVEDGSVVVIAREPSSDGSAPGAPVTRADVTLAAYTTDLEDPIATYDGITGDDGRVAFTGVPRGDLDGAGILLVAFVERSQSTVRADGCVLTESWFGMTPDVASASSIEITVEAPPSSSIACPPTPVLEGIVVGSSGAPIVVDFASVSVVLGADGGAQAFPLEVGADGSFAIELPPLGTAAQPATVTVEVVSAPTRTEPFDERCVRTFAELGSWSADVSLADGEELPFVELTTEEFVVTEVCDTVSPTRPPAPAPAPGGGSGGGTGPTITLPPTDTDARTAVRDAVAGLADAGLPVTLGLAVLAAASLAIGGRRTRSR